MTLHHHLDSDSGAPGSTMALADQYRSRGHDVQLLSWDDLPPRMRGIAKSVAFPYFTAATLERRLSTGDIDLIDAHTGDAWLWALAFRRLRYPSTALVTRSTGLEHVDHDERVAAWRDGEIALRKRYFFYHGGIRLFEVSRALRASDLCILLNRRDHDYARDVLRIPSERLRISGNGIHDFLVGRQRETFPKKDGQAPAIAVIGSFIEKKGIDYSVPALTELMREISSLRIGFFGTGADNYTVLNRFPETLHKRIEIVPRYQQSDLPELLKPYQIQLLASITEGFGKVLLEGMACGLAPVTSDTPGPLEFAEHGENALVVRRRNERDIYRALKSLLSDPILLARLAGNAWNTAQSHSWAGVATRRLRYYEEAIATLPRRRSRA